MTIFRDCDQKGFSLIEVLIAIVVFTIGILGTIIMQEAFIGGNTTANEVTGAANEASDRMETLMALSYDDASLSDVSNTGANAGATGLDNTDAAGSLADGGPVVDGNLTLFWNVADNYPVFGTKTIRVIVRRLDEGVQKTVTYDFTTMEPI